MVGAVDTKVLAARYFAAGAHAAVGQLRKYTNEPYIVHPIEVALIVESVPHTREMLMAALLHDTVEDTKVTLVDIERNFGRVVMFMVEDLTKITKPEDGNRAQRHKIELARLAKAPAAVQTIKLADLMSNTSTIVQHDPKFAAVYLKEKAELLAVLTKGDARLQGQAERLLKESFNKLKGVQTA